MDESDRKVILGIGVEAAYGRFLGRCLGLSANMPVRLVASVDEDAYRRAQSSGGLARGRLRFRLLILYPLRLIWVALRSPRGSLIAVTSNTFYAAALLLPIAKAKRHRFIHILFDLYPEAMVVAGGGTVLKPPAVLSLGFVQGCVARLMAWTLRHAEVTVFPGARLRDYAAARHGFIRKARVVAVGGDDWVVTDQNRDVPKDGPLGILYAGQLGAMHDWQTLHRTWTESSCDGIEFRIHATGRGARLLAEACNESAIKAKVIFGLPLAESGWIAAMHDAPVCLVTLRRGAEYVVFPSKTFSSMLAGQAVLAIAPRESDLADLVIGHGCGWVVEPGDTRALLTVLLEIREQPALLVERRRKAREAALRHYCTEPLVAAWRMVLNDID